MLTFLAWFLSIPRVAAWLIARSQRTPYSDIVSPDGSEIYMRRWWLFNPYPGAGNEKKRWDWLPAVRVHHILVEDRDRHMHDHPWNARTFILRGWYDEKRLDHEGFVHSFTRVAGSTARLRFGEYHQISEVCAGGVYTLFVTWKYRGTWGFLVDGRKIQWREYLGLTK